VDDLGSAELWVLVWIATSVWVFADSLTLRTKWPKGFRPSGLAGEHPGTWMAAVFLIWIIAFPLYLIVRPSIRDAKPAEKRCAKCNQTYSLEYDGCPHCAQAVDNV
jgi:hypothetical protein